MAIGAVTALCVAIFIALALVMNALLAGLLAFLLVGAAAAGLAWLGMRNLSDSL